MTISAIIYVSDKNIIQARIPITQIASIHTKLMSFCTFSNAENIFTYIITFKNGIVYDRNPEKTTAKKIFTTITEKVIKKDFICITSKG